MSMLCNVLISSIFCISLQNKPKSSSSQNSLPPKKRDLGEITKDIKPVKRAHVDINSDTSRDSTSRDVTSSKDRYVHRCCCEDLTIQC